MANWTKATLLKRLVEVLATEHGMEPDEVLADGFSEDYSANEMIRDVQKAVIKEAMR